MTSEVTRPEVDFDHHSTRYAEHWDTARFSTDHDIAGDRTGFDSISIPASPMRAVPFEMDPPEFHAVRGLLNKALSPVASRAWLPWLPWLREVVTEQIDLLIERDECDLIYELGALVPGRFTMRFLGPPESDWQTYALPFHDFMSPPDTEKHQPAFQDLMLLGSGLFEQVVAHRSAPRENFITYLTRCEIDGEPLSDQLVTEICFLIVAGGVDTTTSLFGDAVEWLARNAEQRAHLAADLSWLDLAIEEFLRYFSPTQGTARTAKTDVEIGGQRVDAGERVLLSWARANHDPAEFECPDEVRLDRAPNRHTAFGIGITNGFLSLPTRFTPGPRPVPAPTEESS